MTEEKKLIGEIKHFFTNLNVAVIELSDKLKEGDEILIEGATTSLKQKVSSMQVHNEQVNKAGKGESIGLKVDDRVREGDKVYLVE